MTREDWIFPILEGVCLDHKNGRWSDGAFFDDEDIPIECFQAEPAPHVQDREVWRRWLEYLETSPSAADTNADKSAMEPEFWNGWSPFFSFSKFVYQFGRISSTLPRTNLEPEQAGGVGVPP
jgi:hypothetical protein